MITSTTIPTQADESKRKAFTADLRRVLEKHGQLDRDSLDSAAQAVADGNTVRYSATVDRQGIVVTVDIGRV